MDRGAWGWGVLQSMGWQRVEHDLATKQQQNLSSQAFQRQLKVLQARGLYQSSGLNTQPLEELVHYAGKSGYMTVLKNRPSWIYKSWFSSPFQKL